MDDFISNLYGSYIIPCIENEEVLEYSSRLCRELTDVQGRLYLDAQKAYATKAFLLGLRTGAGLERLLSAGTPSQPH